MKKPKDLSRWPHNSNSCAALWARIWDSGEIFVSLNKPTDLDIKKLEKWLFTAKKYRTLMAKKNKTKIGY